MEPKRSRLQRGLLAALALLVLIFGAILFWNVRQEGIQFRGAFLHAARTEAGWCYSGPCRGENVTISVTPGEGVVSVDLTTGTGWAREYTVESWPDYRPPAGSAFRGAVGIRVTGEGKTLFQGGYEPERGFLIDADGELSQNNVTISADTLGGDPWEDYEPSLAAILGLAGEPELSHRGSVEFYLVMVLLTGLLAVDVAFPEALFRLQHMLSVRDPEPTDFYRVTQKIGWLLALALLLGGYIYAVAVVV